MEADNSQDFQDYWNEIRIIQETKRLDEFLDEEYGGRDDDVEGEGLAETEWLVAAGLGQLGEPFLEGKEVSDTELNATLSALSPHQAQVIKRRVDTLNYTIRQRARQNRARHRKPDIRDVFRDYENSSTGSRSRSATPDSLDSGPPSPPSPWPPTIYQHDPEPEHNNLQITPPQSLMQIFEDPLTVQVSRKESKREVRRLPSAPIPNPFRTANRYGGDIVASETADGIKILNYQRIGSMRYTFSSPCRERLRSGSDPVGLNSTEDSSSPQQSVSNSVREITRSQDSLYSETQHSSGSSCQSIPQTASLEHLGFEETWAGDSITCSHMEESEGAVGRTWVEWLGEEDLVKLQPLAFLELTVLLDQSGIRFPKRKPHKRKRKEDGPVVFGASLSSLLEKDQQITNEQHNVPLVFQKVLAELERRGLQEEGLLRVAAHKQKVQALCDTVERDLYVRPERVDALLLRAPVHDLATLLKRLIRDLPESLLTNQLVDLFYQAHSLGDSFSRALNLLILLLPSPNRATLQCLLSFLNHVINNEQYNKMSAHNVAMIIAPSLFPPRFVNADKGNLKTQISHAAVCCRLTESLLQLTESLFIVPPQLLTQLRELNEQQRHKLKENKPMKKLLGRRVTGRDQITRKIDNEVDFQEGVIRVSATSFLLSDVPVALTSSTTAGEVILRLIEQSSKTVVQAPTNVKMGRKDKSRALSELAPNGNLSCLLATADTEMALQTHFLHEIGGNIGQRRIDPNALLLPIYQENPNAQWVICCDHKNGSNRMIFKK